MVTDLTNAVFYKGLAGTCPRRFTPPIYVNILAPRRSILGNQACFPNMASSGDCPQSIPFYPPEFTTAFIKCGGRALAGFFIGGFISAFARCCFCIADNLLVLTSPMTSPLSLLCQSCCVNGGTVAPPCQTKNYQSLHFFRPSNTGKCIIASK